mgnify:CR=1 FL=1
MAVAQTGSFLDACKIVHLSQPAISITIKKMEETIGGQLFSRTTRNLVLTPEGEMFYPVIKRIVGDWDSAFSDLHNLFSVSRGNLAIAAMPSFASTVLPIHIKTFHQQYPSINIKVHDVIAEDTLAMVRSGKAELAITFDPGEIDDITFEPLFTDDFVAALPALSPLLDNKEINWEMISQSPFIALQRPSSIRYLIDSVLKKNDIELNVEFESNQLATIGQLISSGLGVSVMPSLCIEQLLKMGVECRPLVDPKINRRVGIITKSGNQLSTPAFKFKTLMQLNYMEN